MADNNEFKDRLEEQREQALSWMDSKESTNSENDSYYEAAAETLDKEELKSRKKRERMKNRKEFKISLMKKMMLFSLAPLLIMGLVVTIYSIIEMSSSLKSMRVDSLTNFAKSVEGAIVKDCDGVMEVSGSTLYIGEDKTPVTPEYLDAFTESGGVNITLYYGEVSYASTLKSDGGSRLVGVSLSEEVKNEVLKGNKKFINENDVIGGEKYYSVYIPLKDAKKKTVGVVVASQARNAVDKMVNRQISSLAILAGLILVISTLVVGISSYTVANSTKKMEESLTAISDGYLSITVNLSALSRSDEIGTMARALQNTAKKMTDVIHDINSIIRRLIKAGEKLGSSSEESSVTAIEIGSAIEEISKGAIKQASDAEEADRSVAEMGEGIGAIVDSLSSLKETTEIMLEADKKSDAIISELVESGKQTSVALDEVTKKVNETDKAVSKIQDAVSLITNIAEETSLLSLNASIEAARAGEAGKGFAVVAIQIQKLAEESSKSAEKIIEAIDVLSKDSHASVSVMGEMSTAILEQQKKLVLAREQFDKVSEGIVTTINETKTIYALSQNCASEREKVLGVIESLAAISESNVTATESTTLAMNELNQTINLVSDSAKNLQKMAVALEDKVSFYKL